MNCRICNKIDEHMDICCDCFECVLHKLSIVKKLLKVEYINEITNLTIDFCKYDQIQQHSNCYICTKKDPEPIQTCCYNCRLEIYKRTVLLYNTRENLNDIIEKASRCYEISKFTS
jgi:hypothetical protein